MNFDLEMFSGDQLDQCFDQLADLPMAFALAESLVKPLRQLTVGLEADPPPGELHEQGA